MIPSAGGEIERVPAEPLVDPVKGNHQLFINTAAGDETFKGSRCQVACLELSLKVGSS